MARKAKKPSKPRAIDPIELRKQLRAAREEVDRMDRELESVISPRKPGKARRVLARVASWLTEPSKPSQKPKKPSRKKKA
jgi:hypothetical protein